jgi:hypothetical protein
VAGDKGEGALTWGGGSDGGRRGQLQRARCGTVGTLSWHELKKSLGWALGHVQSDQTVDVGRAQLIHFPLF